MLQFQPKMRNQTFVYISGRQHYTWQNFGLISRVGNTMTQGREDFDLNKLCHRMPEHTNATNQELATLNYLHPCENGPIPGRYIVIHREQGDNMAHQISEIYAWDGLQLEDKSEMHSEFGHKEQQKKGGGKATLPQQKK